MLKFPVEPDSLELLSAIGEQHTGCVITAKDGGAITSTPRDQIDLRLGNIVIKHARGIIIIDAGKPDGETLVIPSSPSSTDRCHHQKSE